MKRLLLLSLIASNVKGMDHGDIDPLGRAVYLITMSGWDKERKKELFYRETERRLTNRMNLDLPIKDTVPLEYFIKNKDLTMVKRLLEAGATPSSKFLETAIVFKNDESAEELLRFKADPNEMLKNTTPLHCLCSNINDSTKSSQILRLAQLLLSHGACPNIYSKGEGFGAITPLHELLFHSIPSNDEIVEFGYNRDSIILLRKKLVHMLIFRGGAHLLTVKDMRKTPLEVVKLVEIFEEEQDPDLIALAALAEKLYVSRMVQLCWIKDRIKDGAIRGLPPEPNLIQTLPRSLLKFIADRTV